MNKINTKLNQNLRVSVQVRKIYHQPFVKKICIDNEISLAMESEPPYGPDESFNQNHPNLLLNDPFKPQRI